MPSVNKPSIGAWHQFNVLYSLQSLAIAQPVAAQLQVQPGVAVTQPRNSALPFSVFLLPFHSRPASIPLEHRPLHCLPLTTGCQGPPGRKPLTHRLILHQENHQPWTTSPSCACAQLAFVVRAGVSNSQWQIKAAAGT